MAASNNSVDKAIGLLRLVAQSHRPLRFTDLQAASGIPKGTLHSLLASLEQADFLTRTSNSYEIGVGAFEVGTAVRGPASLRAAASKLLDELFAEHGEACHFGMLHQGDVVYLDCRNSMHELRFISRIGSRKPAYATALGKAMLSLHPDEQVEAIYPASLPVLTATTMTDRAELIARLGVARFNGYATESEESTPGVCCIGVAGRCNDLIYGLSITVPVQRATAASLPGYLPALTATLKKLDRALTATEWFVPGTLAVTSPD